ncbi:M66 family metalloprotease [Aeoliella sp.]|uniref:M66 family metalloprotease n=1 Tax=Aeoliella sp. TaxID=2795800 RepID=UPI003CCC0C22
MAVAPYPLEDTFFLHSNPGADHVIYIDADGYQDNLGYDKDGDPNTFNDDEREELQRIWARVKEDFLPFDIDVTTEYPGQDALTKGLLFDDDWGVRVVIYQGPGENGGHASVGSFDNFSDTPAWADQNGVGTGNKNLAEVISHEAGHTLGLTHDGREFASGDDEVYYRGHGSGTTGWAPIMGVAYSKEVSQWSRGEYADANNQQDDLAIITNSTNGFGYRTDDHGSTLGTATFLPTISGIGLEAEGIIERNTDKDVFRFAADLGGPLSLTISPAEIGPNLDIQAILYNSSGEQVAISSPANNLGASFDLSLTPGDYYLEINGVGSTGDPVTGYNDYGSLGYFSILGTLFTPLAADLNQNGMLDTGDIDAFVAVWRSTSEGSIEEHIAHGDFNLDGITDLHDAFFMHQAFQAAGQGGLTSGLVAVPEPASVVSLLGLVGIGAVLRRRRSAASK